MLFVKISLILAHAVDVAPQSIAFCKYTRIFSTFQCTRRKITIFFHIGKETAQQHAGDFKLTQIPIFGSQRWCFLVHADPADLAGFI